MKGQVLPEELQWLGTEQGCGYGVNMGDRTVKTDRVEMESKSQKLTMLNPFGDVVYLSKQTNVTKTSLREVLYLIFQLIYTIIGWLCFEYFMLNHSHNIHLETFSHKGLKFISNILF